MPLYIKDPTVDDLAEKVRVELGMRTKTDAVRMALQHELQRSARSKPLRERLAALQEQADIQFTAPVHGIDMKKLMDDLWEDGA
jgi:antitoxin VapB